MVRPACTARQVQKQVQAPSPRGCDERRAGIGIGWMPAYWAGSPPMAPRARPPPQSCPHHFALLAHRIFSPSLRSCWRQFGTAEACRRVTGLGTDRIPREASPGQLSCRRQLHVAPSRGSLGPASGRWSSLLIQTLAPSSSEKLPHSPLLLGLQFLIGLAKTPSPCYDVGRKRKKKEKNTQTHRHGCPLAERKDTAQKR